jgi:hypothetical protein
MTDDKKAERMLEDAAYFIAATLAKPDPVAWRTIGVYMPTATIFSLLLSRIDWDGMDPDSFTIGELRRAV